MKDLKKLYNECRAELTGIGMDISNNIISVTVNNRFKRALGRCTYDNFRKDYAIEIAPCLLQDAVEVKATKNTIMHELIHTCPKCMNHGYQWKHRAFIVNMKLGYNIQTMTDNVSLEAANVILPSKYNSAFKYALECPQCHAQWKYKRWCTTLENPGKWNCGKCHVRLKTVGLNGNEVLSCR